MVENVDLSTFVNDIKDQIQHLEKEEELEVEAVKEQRDAEQKLAEALKAIQQEEAVFRAIIYFRKVDLESATHAQVHQQVEKIIDKNARIASAGQLETEVEKVNQLMKKIEEAEQEIRDAEGKVKQAVKDEEAVDADMSEISQLISEMGNGADKYRKWAKGS